MATVELCMVISRTPSPFGHAAHLGGAAGGVIYYALIGRRFGGVLGRPQSLRRKDGRDSLEGDDECLDALMESIALPKCMH